ncbi:RagB/SusD family nutrient uptake outer membrane protein [Olivibacter sp. XZL3]|uniref:RagB/SusD family nutrient uptake outer membrane protein n=1 Tax=Olivibacter sp. XZL3 TaxID=1735116 RepID=UPI001066D3D8|nr:RagB/SusD family nutrient uptake outer membrane protein [Olivibacter sp. XZL3]
MKKYILLACTTVFLLGLGGCGKDFLDKDPLDRLTADQYWKTKADFDMALTAIYGQLQNSIFSYGMPNWDVLTDNGYGQHNYNGSQGIVRGEIFPSSGGYITDIYNASYAGIARANSFLFNLSAYDGSELDAASRARYEGEARFMRGFYYYMLYACYGAVPVVTEPLTLDNQAQPKAAASEVLNQTLADLDVAINTLPSILYANGGGHAVKTAAQSLKLRVLMYAAYNREGVPDPLLLAEASALAREIRTAGYTLAPAFESVFRDGMQEGNPEIIFSIKFLAPDNATTMDQWYGDWAVVSPLPNLFNAFEPGDLRRDLTIFDREVNFDGVIHRPSNNVPTGYGLKKFLSPGLIPYGYSTQSQQDWVMLRYAEVLLLFAEAENELSGPTPEVLDALNTIRGRAGLQPLAASLTKDEMREAIRHERRMELAFEGLRYFDLKRWRIAEEVLNNVNDGVLTYRFEERFYEWPLPQTEIDKSEGVLVQNPNY